MPETIWTVPQRRVDAATARRTILLQHARIRAFLAPAQQVAERALDRAPQPDDMAEEERELLSPDVVRDDAVVIDQNSG